MKAEMLPGELSPCGRLRLRDPVEKGWEVVEPLPTVPVSQIGHLALVQTVEKAA